jgi:CheY-like chemotaxis protein
LSTRPRDFCAAEMTDNVEFHAFPRGYPHTWRIFRRSVPPPRADLTRGETHPSGRPPSALSRHFLPFPEHPFRATIHPPMATVLVVDDDPQITKPLARLLKMEGYDVICAANAIMAMAQALHHEPDVILLDVAMPPMDGLTFLFLLRDKPYGRTVPVIVVSGQEDENTMRRARNLGVNDYLIKSQYKTRDLLALIRQYCPACAEALTATAADHAEEEHEEEEEEESASSS